MKNKKSIFLLLPLVLIVWGGVLYQFFSFSNTDEISENVSTELTIKPFKIKEKKPFLINVNYRDPFLGKINTTERVIKPNNNITKNQKNSIPVEEIVWPSILYKGMVWDTNDKKKLFIVIISGHDFLMKKGDIENGILLKDGNKESIYIKYKGNLNLIMLEE